MNWLEQLVDPRDQSDLTIVTDSEGKVVQVASETSEYRITNSHPDLIPDPLPPHLSVRQELWNKLQDNGSLSYDASPDLNLSTDDEFAAAFRRATGLYGFVLDIGCGPQNFAPRYLENSDVTQLIGLDPLPGAAERNFPFVVGIAEALPFREATFDGVVFCRSLDHVLDTANALHEALRVLKPGGSLMIVMDLVSEGRKSVMARTWHLASRGANQFFKSARKHGILHAIRYIWTLGRLEVPEGAEDMFHMHFPAPDEVSRILKRAGVESVRFHDLGHDETICIAAK